MSTPTPLTRSALTTAIREFLIAGTQLAVGDGRPPQPLPPANESYYVLYELPGAFRHADAVDLYGGAVLQYQLTAVGQYRDVCAAAADRARGLMTREALETALDEALGISVAACGSDGPGATEPRGAVFNTPETYTVAVFRTA